MFKIVPFHDLYVCVCVCVFVCVCVCDLIPSVCGLILLGKAHEEINGYCLSGSVIHLHWQLF